MLVSVIIPVYNGEKYIRECLNSVLNQTINDYEVIVINDGSNDGTQLICEEFNNKFINVRVFHFVNRGVSAARNIGIKKAKGDYVVFVDADDSVHEKYLEKLLSHMHKGGMVSCQWCKEISDYSLDTEAKVITKRDAQKSVFFHLGMLGVPFGKVFDRSLLISGAIYFDEEIAICEDTLFVLQYIREASGPIVCIGDRLYYYAENRDGALNSRFDENKPLKKGDLTELDALNKCKKYLLHDQDVEKYYEMQKIKSSVVTLRTMYAKKIKNEELATSLLKYVRKNMLEYIFCNAGAFTSKISVVLCAISPMLELSIWKKRGKHR